MSTKYRTIVADPPWDHSDGTGVKFSIGDRANRRPMLDGPQIRTLQYPTMTVAEISALPVSELAESDAHLYLWATNRYVESAYGVARSWGFKPTTLLTWCKDPNPGWLPGGTFPSNTEFILFAHRGSLPALSRANGRWFVWPRLRGPSVAEGQKRNTKHSAKPEAFLDLVESVSPGPYLELFARRNRLGWSTWGNECLDHGVAL